MIKGGEWKKWICSGIEVVFLPQSFTFEGVGGGYFFLYGLLLPAAALPVYRQVVECASCTHVAFFWDV
jgi:hypothetical protein